MRIPTLNDEETHHPGRTGGGILAVVAVSVIVLAALFFWPEPIAAPVTDPEVIKSLQYIGESQQRTISGLKAINESLTTEHAHLNMLSDQFSALEERLKMLESSGTQILRDNAKLAEQLKATQAQMAEDNASVAEQLKNLGQTALAGASATEQLKAGQEPMAGVIAKVSEEPPRPIPLPLPRPTVAPKHKPAALSSQARIQPQSPIKLHRGKQ
jgi:septal ring factor EnvC (AmiA/AmiB activator)